MEAHQFEVEAGSNASLAGQVHRCHMPVRVLVAWMVDQHKGLVFYDTHATAELW